MIPNDKEHYSEKDFVIFNRKSGDPFQEPLLRKILWLTQLQKIHNLFFYSTWQHKTRFLTERYQFMKYSDNCHIL